MSDQECIYASTTALSDAPYLLWSDKWDRGSCYCFAHYQLENVLNLCNSTAAADGWNPMGAGSICQCLAAGYTAAELVYEGRISLTYWLADRQTGWPVAGWTPWRRTWHPLPHSPGWARCVSLYRAPPSPHYLLLYKTHFYIELDGNK